MSGRTQREHSSAEDLTPEFAEEVGKGTTETGRSCIAGRGAPIARSSAWSRMIEGARIDEPLLVHWVDEQGSVVRLMTSTPPSTIDTQRGIRGA